MLIRTNFFPKKIKVEKKTEPIKNITSCKDVKLGTNFKMLSNAALIHLTKNVLQQMEISSYYLPYNQLYKETLFISASFHIRHLYYCQNTAAKAEMLIHRRELIVQLTYIANIVKQNAEIDIANAEDIIKSSGFN